MMFVFLCFTCFTQYNNIYPVSFETRGTERLVWFPGSRPTLNPPEVGGCIGRQQSSHNDSSALPSAWEVVGGIVLGGT